MKAYTDIEQSKKLAEILPIESADMYYTHGVTVPDVMTCSKQDYRCYTICWSLAALLNYIKDKCGYFELVYLSSTFDGRANKLENVYRLSTDVYDVYQKESVDACYEMILKLHEEKI